MGFLRTAAAQFHANTARPHPALRLPVLLIALSCLVRAGEQPLASPTPAATLYEQLRTVGLDSTRVYQIRDATLDREDIHLTLNTGTIAFSEDVEGRITAAFFEGDGEILLVPPNRAERSSLALFTGAAILEEAFTTAYFRFNNSTFEQLKPYLRPADSAPEFVSRWDPVAHSLAAADALALLQSFTFVPPAGMGMDPDVFFHARLSGVHLRTFDAFLTSTAQDQVFVGQAGYVGESIFYDAWAAFPMKSVRDKTAHPPLWEGEAPLRVTKYGISARVMPPHDLQADALLDCVATAGGLRTIVFELSRYLQVSEVSQEGQLLEFIQNPALEGSALARRGNDVVAVVLPRPLAAGARLQLRFTYGGSVLSEAGGGLMYVGARGMWYPNRGSQMSDFDLEFRSPTTWTLVATGNKVFQQTIGGEEVSRWVSDRPMPLAGFNLGRYVFVSTPAGGTMIQAYAARGVERTFAGAGRAGPAAPPLFSSPVPANEARSVAERTARALDFFSHQFGPFPYTSLSLTQMPGKDSQGWPGLVFLSSYAFLGREEAMQLHMNDFQQLLFRELTPAHEAAHQWWGDLVTWNSYRDVWLPESLANYSALLLMESRNPAHFWEIMGSYRQDLLAPSKSGRPLTDAGAVTLGPRLTSSRFPQGYEIILYGRGSWLLHMLRYILRDATASRVTGTAATAHPPADPDARFYRVLRGLCERFAGRVMTTDDVERAFEEELPQSAWYEGRKSLAWFFDGWVNGTAIPKLELENVKLVRRNGKQMATARLVQREAPQNLVTFVPIYATVGKDLVFIGHIFADGHETPARFQVPAGTRALVVDPYKTILRRP